MELRRLREEAEQFVIWGKDFNATTNDVDENREINLLRCDFQSGIKGANERDGKRILSMSSCLIH